MCVCVGGGGGGGGGVVGGVCARLDYFLSHMLDGLKIGT